MQCMESAFNDQKNKDNIIINNKYTQSKSKLDPKNATGHN